jgi:hypothetical protein
MAQPANSTSPSKTERNHMTVKKLIAKLKEMPQDAEVVLGDGTMAETVSLDRYDNVCNCDDRVFDGRDQIEPNNDEQVVLIG